MYNALPPEMPHPIHLEAVINTVIDVSRGEKQKNLKAENSIQPGKTRRSWGQPRGETKSCVVGYLQGTDIT